MNYLKALFEQRSCIQMEDNKIQIISTDRKNIFLERTFCGANRIGSEVQASNDLNAVTIYGHLVDLDFLLPPPLILVFCRESKKLLKIITQFKPDYSSALKYNCFIDNVGFQATFNFQNNGKMCLLLVSILHDDTAYIHQCTPIIDSKALNN